MTSAHRLKRRVLVNAQRSAITGNGNQFGTYLYNSLADLDAGRPALFARSLGGTDQGAGTNSAALYVGDAWRYSPSLQIVYGGRVETTQLPGAPAVNAAVQQAFGVSTNAWPRQVRVTPRLGFTSLLGNVAGMPAGSLKGGVGLFRGTVPSGLVGAVANGNGLVGAQSQVVCTGAAVPVPDGSRLGSDENTIPRECLVGVGVAPSASRPCTPDDPAQRPSLAACRSCWPRPTCGPPAACARRPDGSPNGTAVAPHGRRSWMCSLIGGLGTVGLMSE